MSFVIKNHKIFPSLINSEREAKEAIEDFGLNFCKLSARLRNNKKLAKKAVEKDPFSLIYLDEKLRDDEDIKEVITEEYLDHLIDPIGVYIEKTNDNLNKEERINKIVELRNEKRYEIEAEIDEKLNKLAKTALER